MTQDLRATAGDPALRDARGSASLGDELLAQVDLDAVAARLAGLPTAALLGELEGIVIAIDNADPERRRRRSGFFGRLLGRDLVAQAQPDPVDTRVRLHLSSARTLAERLAKLASELEPLAPWLLERALRLRELITATPLEAEAAPSLARRRDHLAAVVATWETTAAQVEMVHQHAILLLARHAQVRDVLVPAWRQQTLLAGSSVRSDAAAAARLDAALREQLATLREALRAPIATTESPRTTTTPTGTDAGSANKESLP